MNAHLKPLLALMLALTGPALATEAEDLARAKMCFSCHDLNAENFGPSLRDISRRFYGLKNAKRMLVREVQAGTNLTAPGALHHWGNMKMPKDSDRVPVTQEEAEQLVDYILGLK